MILLLSSNAARRYGDDIIRALAHPSGTDLQFRYDLRHLDPAVKARVAAGDLARETALIAFLATDPAAKTATLTSVRLAKIKRAEIVGTSCILSLTASSYVHPLDDATVRAILTAPERQLLPAWTTGPHPTGSFAIAVAGAVPAGKLAQRGEEMKAFEDTAAALGNFSPFEDAGGPAFFAVRGLSVIDPPEWHWWQRDPAPKLESGRYEVLSGFRYRLDVYSYRPAGSTIATPPTKLTVSTDEKAIQFFSAKEAVLDSRYDLNRFSFTTDAVLKSLPAPITIALSIASGTPPATEQRCDITLALRFGGWRTQAFLRTFLIAVGTASSAIIGVAYKDQFSWGIGLAMCVGPLIAAYTATIPLFSKSS